MSKTLKNTPGANNIASLVRGYAGEVKRVLGLCDKEEVRCLLTQNASALKWGERNIQNPKELTRCDVMKGTTIEIWESRLCGSPVHEYLFQMTVVYFFLRKMIDFKQCATHRHGQELEYINYAYKAIMKLASISDLE